ncbi:MAG TPA: preprotein translocase subunit SecG [Phycisphaerae bacterium]|nr:preprotein translocase subunit SecG [Phycisphaerae bacterium]
MRWIITVLFVTICILLITVVLLQKGRGGGLAGAFGGAGGHSAFGAKTGDVFTWITIALTAMFVVVSIIGNFTFIPDSEQIPTPMMTPADAPESGGAAPAEAPLSGSPVATQPGG